MVGGKGKSVPCLVCSQLPLYTRKQPFDWMYAQRLVMTHSGHILA